jgi:hypothetical protein
LAFGHRRRPEAEECHQHGGDHNTISYRQNISTSFRLCGD